VHEPLDAYAADVLCDLLLTPTTTHPPANSATAAPVGKKARRVTARPVYTTNIVIDHEVIVAGNHLPGKRCEIPGVGPVNVDWVRSILGEAFVTAIIKHGTDITTVAHFGRNINAELKTALLVQGAECVVCGHRGYLEIDHHHDLAKGGPTSLANLGPLCWTCHHRKNIGWTLHPPDPTTHKHTLTPPPHTGPDP
jgi:5-methylcytosine-specific restriction endonuclease McrA